MVLGVIVGGKVGSLLFYQTELLFTEPLQALNPFGPYGFRGMSFHGGFLGVLVTEPRHPNQLYQFFFEGVVLFIIVWVFSSKPRPARAVSGVFVICYGIYRFFIEFVRQPDADLGFIAFDWLTMGQLLSKAISPKDISAEDILAKRSSRQSNKSKRRSRKSKRAK